MYAASCVLQHLINHSHLLQGLCALMAAAHSSANATGVNFIPSSDAAINSGSKEHEWWAPDASSAHMRPAHQKLTILLSICLCVLTTSNPHPTADSGCAAEHSVRDLSPFGALPTNTGQNPVGSSGVRFSPVHSSGTLRTSAAAPYF
jgi:hypothetical protein